MGGRDKNETRFNSFDGTPLRLATPLERFSGMRLGAERERASRPESQSKEWFEDNDRRVAAMSKLPRRPAIARARGRIAIVSQGCFTPFLHYVFASPSLIGGR
jgi:hypothetical protein